MHLSVDEYQRLGEIGELSTRTELLFGVVYDKPRKSPLECYLTAKLEKSLQRALPSGMHVRMHQPITIAAVDSEPEPNLAVVIGTYDDYTRAHPRSAELVIEVFNDDGKFDHSKLRAYAFAQISECWLISEIQRSIEIFRRPIGESFADFGKYCEGRVDSTVLPNFGVDLPALFPV